VGKALRDGLNARTTVRNTKSYPQSFDYFCAKKMDADTGPKTGPQAPAGPPNLHKCVFMLWAYIHRAVAEPKNSGCNSSDAGECVWRKYSHRGYGGRIHTTEIFLHLARPYNAPVPQYEKPD
jgi:hypothetical protein